MLFSTIKDYYIAPKLLKHFYANMNSLPELAGKPRGPKQGQQPTIPLCNSHQKKYWRSKEKATEWWVTKQNKNKSRLKCTQYKPHRHVSDMPLVRPWGFPWLYPGLTYWLCGLQMDCGAARWKSWYPAVFLFVFFHKALILLSGSEWHILQCNACPEEGGGENLGNRRGEKEGATVFSCVLNWIRELKNQSVWRLYCTVLRNSGDRQVTGRL